MVLCPAIGWEAEATYRTLVRWAEILAAAGFPVLRFDYSGTGDSPGSDEDPGRVAAWIESVHAAVEAARRMSGSARVALAGLHSGATLAARAAAERTDVEALVAWGAVHHRPGLRPAAPGLPAAQCAPADPRGTPAGADEEAAGYRLTRVDGGELEALDLRALTRAPAPRVLLLSARRRAPDKALASAWKERGAEADLGGRQRAGRR